MHSPSLFRKLATSLALLAMLSGCYAGGLCPKQEILLHPHRAPRVMLVQDQARAGAFVSDPCLAEAQKWVTTSTPSVDFYAEAQLWRCRSDRWKALAKRCGNALDSCNVLLLEKPAVVESKSLDWPLLIAIGAGALAAGFGAGALLFGLPH